jgi:hypothetical protein
MTLFLSFNNLISLSLPVKAIPFLLLIYPELRKPDHLYLLQ